MGGLVALLDGFYEPVLILYAGMTAATFVALWFVAAPYGRFVRKGWGPVVPAFWGWIIMEMPVVVALPLCWVIVGAPFDQIGLVFMVIWLSHYIHRTLYWPVVRRNTFGSMPVAIVLLAIFFNLVNGFSNGWFVFGRQDYGPDWLTTPHFLIGLVVFVIGMVININSDQVLLRLKRAGKGYQIPEEGFHRWVASPNYMGEILEWIGWAILTWSTAGVLFAAYTIANLAPRARSNLNWYRETFEDYPEERKALIPGVW